MQKADTQPVWFEDIAVDDQITPLVKVPTTVGMFRFSAMTWNAHRIHYDQAYARTEGHPDVLVQGTLFGSYLVQLVQDWAGPRARLRRLGFSNRRPAVAGETLTCRGRITAKRVEGEEGLVNLEIHVENARGEVCVPGTATVALPRRE